ncbi:CDP-diacylglycerol--serine O-phosphatidyltransferase [Sulfitobacter alexandrii]|uniref:CDP-diacylglycerol--serine O-phosphatidyltransferase n=1 Tax=Sulfitobacter alexandrii TaxID=1917485 RepID=A0A1J0WGZ4_9RHOB|nr:CDP-diacylglycerol--serine O-phosphatidyltransferase [Sulfitobacter alexandrii]APE43591.1 CDP-diacylglycerol--serine O-phosphatidyltransferase [Sulfitobacter alexandrii]
MSEPSPPPSRDVSLLQLLPNILTITAICAGLSAIRFGVQGNYVLAVQLIVAACVLDGVDGHLARLLKSDSKIGAELDSLADFVNFGVAPPLVLYFWALQDLRSAAWLAVLFYAICCVLRLARFNVASREPPSSEAQVPPGYFTGIPSPAGALLVLLPLSISFAFANGPLLPDLVICLHMVVIGLLMISRVPTWSIKALRIRRAQAPYVTLCAVLLAAALLTFAWITLVILCLAYIAMVVWTLIAAAPRFSRKDS